MKELWNPLFEISKSRSFLALNAFLCFLLVNAIVSEANCKKDLSRSKRFELTSSTRKLASALDSTLYIDAFYSSKVPGEYKARLELTQQILKEIESAGNGKILLRFYDPDTSLEDARKAADSGIEPQILQKAERGSASVKQAYLGVSLRLGSKTEVIPVAFFAEQIEYQILSGIRKMSRSGSDSGIGVLKTDSSLGTQAPGPGTGKDTIGIFLHQVLETTVGEVPEIDPEKGDFPDGLETLLWVGSGSLSEAAKYRLDQFLVKGGNLILLGKAMEFRMEGAGNRMGILTGGTEAGAAYRHPRLGDLNSFLEHYGIRIHSNLVLDPDHSLPMGPLVEVEPGILGRAPYPLWIVSGKKDRTLAVDSDYTKEQENLLLPWCSSLELIPDRQPNAKLTPLVFSGEEAEIRSDQVMLGEKQLSRIPIRPNGGPFVLGAILEGPLLSYFHEKALPKGTRRESFLTRSPKDKIPKILAFGTPYLVSDILAFPEYGDIFRDTNIPFLLNSIDFMEGDSDLSAVRSKQSLILKMDPISVGTENLISILNIFGVPVILSLYATLRIARRRRMQPK
ncbi:gliding motility ABC transporter [Leptospira fluminis]|uniref:Gliding motility ABC transporter n=1 Tax=Leptospira fluminis TaxID=2484979 RepID=A0A4R9GP78_9LEPT|nr:GldG family protein [Leptospira fluminis]TGK17466.1 gliding motility ABC transporter [Leptospira fluminis]